MFPLKHRRKNIRISNVKFKAKIVLNDIEEIFSIESLSASGISIKENNKIKEISLGSKVRIKFVFDDVSFDIESKKVRDYAFSFKHGSDIEKEELNRLVLEEYFKDNPSLIDI